MKKKTVCRVLWFDAKGRFAKAPKTIQSKPKAGLGPTKATKGKVVRVDGGGTAIIKHYKSGVRVTYIPPAEIRKEVEQNKGNKKYAASYKAWIRNVQKELAQDAIEKRKLTLRRKYNAAMEKSQASDKGKKGANERAKSRSVEQKLSELSNAELLNYKPQNVYEVRAKRNLLKKRNLNGR